MNPERNREEERVGFCGKGLTRYFVEDFLLQATPETLGRLRVGVFGIALVSMLLRFPAGLSELPPGVFQPPGLFALVPMPFWEWLLQDAVMIPAYAGLCLFTGLSILGWPNHRGMLLCTVLGLWVFDAVLKGHGAYINHAQCVLLYVATLLALFPQSAECALVKPKEKPAGLESSQATVLLCAGILTVPYALLGIRRLSAGPGIFLDNTILHEVARRSLEPSEFGFTFVYEVLSIGWVAVLLKAGFLVITLLEAFAPLILISPKFRRVWVWTMIPFHLSTLFTMNIFFWENCLLILLLFTPLIYRMSDSMQNS